MEQIIKVAWDLNENTENRYQLVYEIAELAKKLVDENQAKKAHDEFVFEENYCPVRLGTPCGTTN